MISKTLSIGFLIDSKQGAFDSKHYEVFDSKQFSFGAHGFKTPSIGFFDSEHKVFFILRNFILEPVISKPLA